MRITTAHWGNNTARANFLSRGGNPGDRAPCSFVRETLGRGAPLPAAPARFGCSKRSEETVLGYTEFILSGKLSLRYPTKQKKKKTTGRGQVFSSWWGQANITKYRWFPQTSTCNCCWTGAWVSSNVTKYYLLLSTSYHIFWMILRSAMMIQLVVMIKSRYYWPNQYVDIVRQVYIL